MTSSDKRGPRQVPPPDNAARPGGSYARFIPREELAEFASWTPDAFAGLSEAQRSHPASLARAAAAAQRQAAATPAPPPEPPPPTEQEWLARVSEARQHGYQDGYRDGLEALEAAKRQHLAQVSQQVAQVVAGFDEQLQALEQQMAQAVAETAVALARQVVRSELAQRPELIVDVAQEAVNAVLLSARHLRLRLHPKDLALVEAGAGEALRAREVRLQADAALAPGGCLVESDLGQVDARIEQRWARAAGVFATGQGWNDAPSSPEDTTEVPA